VDLNHPMSLQQMLSQQKADGLAEAALWVASEVDHSVDVSQYLRCLHFYAEMVSDRLPSNVRLGDALFQLNNFLFNDRGFASINSSRCSSDNLFLDRVIDNRHGSPLSIALIYLTVGRLLGLPLKAVSFSDRILLRYSDSEGDVVIDPDEGGMPLQKDDLERLFSLSYALPRQELQQRDRFLATTDDKTLLIRMLFQLKQSYLQRSDAQSALWVLEKVLLLDPRLPSAYRERGYLYECLDCNVAAANDYHRYLELQPNAGDAALIRLRLQKLLESSVIFH
jgi:regulator of sirC expression with transglutaminase-like and TPR domain